MFDPAAPHMLLVLLVVICLVFGRLGYGIGKRKGRRGLRWVGLVLGLVGSLLGLIILAMIPAKGQGL